MKGLRVEIVVRREGAPVEEAIAQPVTRSPRSGQILQIAAFGPSMAPPGPRVLGAQR